MSCLERKSAGDRRMSPEEFTDKHRELCAKNVQDESFLKIVLNEIEYAIGHYEPLDYSKVSTPYPPSENHFETPAFTCLVAEMVAPFR